VQFHLLSDRQVGAEVWLIRYVRECGNVCAIMLLLFLSACTSAAPPPPRAAAPPPPRDPDYYSQEEVPGQADYIERCHHLNRDFEEANIVYSTTGRMRRADAQIIEAAATLRTELPPQEILESEDAIGSRVRVSCEVEAELRGAEADFDIQQPGWQKRSLLTSPTARWTWSVKPKRGGDHELVLAVRPVIVLEDEMGNPLPHRDLETSAQTYRIMLDVSVPADQWLAAGFDRVTSLLTSARGMILAFSALAAAIYGLRFAIRRKRAKSPPTSDAAPS